MTDGWRDLRKADRDLAFSLLFAPATRRNLLADRLLLAHEAETAIRLASEPLLAAIRLQWWHDAVEKRRHENVPLMTRLLSHIEAGHITADDLTTQLALWQDRREQGSDGAAARWRDLFVILAGSGDVTEAAGMIGAALVEPDRTVAILDRHIDDLAISDAWWIGMLGLLQRHRQAVPASDAEPTLIWRMLGWRYGFRRPQEQQTIR